MVLNAEAVAQRRFVNKVVLMSGNSQKKKNPVIESLKEDAPSSTGVLL